VAQEPATRVRIAVEVAETALATAAFPVAEGLAAPAHSVGAAGTAVAAHGAAVHAAHPAWAVPAVAPEAVAAGAGGD
jgi:hypothetical protein